MSSKKKKAPIILGDVESVAGGTITTEMIDKLKAEMGNEMGKTFQGAVAVGTISAIGTPAANVPQWIRDAARAANMTGFGNPETVTVTVQAPPVPEPVQLNSTPDGRGCWIEPKWYRQVKMGTHPNERGAILFGPAGTGKTTAVHRLAADMGVELVTFQAAEGCALEDLVGNRELVDGDKGPKTSFTDGPLPEALRKDCWMLIEEANAMRPGVFSKMNTLLDGSGDKLRLPTGERLAAGKNFKLWLAYNPGYSGMKEMNQALVDRLVPVYTTYLPETDEARVLEAVTRCDPGTAMAVASMAAKIRAAKTRFDLSLRSMFRLMRYVRSGASWEQAFEWAILDRIGCPSQRQADRDVIRNIAMIDNYTTWATPTWKPDPADAEIGKVVGSVIDHAAAAEDDSAPEV